VKKTDRGNREERYGRATYQRYSRFNSSLDPTIPRQKWKVSYMQSSSKLCSTTPGSCTPATSLPPQEQTKGGDAAPTVPAYGTIIAKSTRVDPTQATTATIWRPLYPKITSRFWTAGRATGGRHSIHGGRTDESPCNRRRKGVTGGGTPDKGHDRSFDHRPTGYTLPQTVVEPLTSGAG
jgi:hypothetical protein